MEPIPHTAHTASAESLSPPEGKSIALEDTGKSVTIKKPGKFSVTSLTQGVDKGNISFTYDKRDETTAKTYALKIGSNTPLFKHIQEMSSLSTGELHRDEIAAQQRDFATLIDLAGRRTRELRNKIDGESE